MREGKVIVFAGPSSPSHPLDSLAEGGVEWRGPARRGDVLTALGDRPRTLVIVDGYWYTRPAVTHKEILYALDAGVPVVGAASMGALRAAEMDRFGMVGVGWVYEQYRTGEITGDDEVAVLHADAEHGYRSLTVALVEVRAALERLGWDGDELVEALRGMAFSERHPATVERLARETLGEERAEALRGEMTRTSVKADDARRAVEAVLRGVEAPAGTRDGSFLGAGRATEYLSHFKEWDLRAGPEETAPAFRAAWNVTQLLHPEAEGFVETVRRRFVCAAAAERAGLEVPEDAVGAAVEALRGHPAPRLPETEVRDEALVAARAARAVAEWGSEAEAARRLAEELRLAGEGMDALLELLAIQDDILAPWHLVRAFAFTDALAPALETAAAARRVADMYREWSEGARIRRDALDRLIAGLWNCPVEELPSRAARRGLFESHGFTPGFRDAAELIAAAERLGERGGSGYAEAVARLRGVPLRLRASEV